MRFSRAFIPTLREEPSEAEVTSHKLMLRSGMIRLHASGVYSYLPLGWRVMRKVEGIIREEMERIGAQEFLLPSLSRRDLWERTGRWEEYGENMFRLKDRRGADLALAPTHEEVFAEIASHEIRSYRDLPQIWYQIGIKFRDEARPRSGVLRGRQFIMKDSYSFDADEEGLKRSYELHREAYLRIFKRCGLDVVTVKAHSGIMGGSESEEFMVPSPAGEDKVVLCGSCGYAANVEVAASVPAPSGGTSRPKEKVHTPGMRTIEEVSGFLGRPPSKLMKSLIFMAGERPVMVLVRGDYEVNEAKLEGEIGPFRPAEPEEIERITGAPVGFVGPVGLEGVEILADETIRGQVDLATGANLEDYHWVGLEPERDFRVDRYVDVRTVREGDGCPKCGAGLRVLSAIEVGHIFQLGTKYSEALGATYLDEKGRAHPIVMGSYGIGLERIVASVIEQHADESGMVWPISIAPYEIYILPVNWSDPKTRDAAEELYGKLSDGHEVLLDDRDERAGVKFKDADLLGIPVRLTLGRGLKDGKVEVRRRKDGRTWEVPLEDAAGKVEEVLEGLWNEVRV